MCTAIAKKGNDLIYGFNLDIDPEVWSFKLYRNKKHFTVGITVGNTLYYTHGISREGNFGNIPYMNAEVFHTPRGMKRERIDLITDRYIRGKYSFEDIEQIVRTKAVVNPPAATMHSLIGNGKGDFLIIEPGYGYKKTETDYAVLSNFPVLTSLQDYSNPFYGKDRYDHAFSVLQNSTKDFSVQNALDLLNAVQQTGRWGTRISFVFSKNNHAVYYCMNGDFSNIQIHSFN